MPRRRGISMLQGVLVMPIILGFGSFAVDFGRVQLARNELSTAADAAALYAAQGLGDNTAVTRARTAAMENRADGKAIPSAAISTLTGRWANGAFTSGGTPANAVSVTLRYRRADGNGVPLTLGSVLGILPMEVSSNSVALADDTVPDITGLDSVQLLTGGAVKNWTSSSNTFPTYTSTSAVKVGSNGTWSSTGGGYIEGRALYFAAAPAAGVAKAGSTQLTQALAANTETVPSNAYNLGAVYVNGAGTSYINSGVYYASSVYIGGTAVVSLNITNNLPVEIYVTGPMTATGAAQINVNGLPKNFIIHLTSTSTFSVTGNSKIFGVLTSKLAPLEIDNSDFRGSVIAKSIKASSNASLYFDTTLRQVTNAASANLVK